MKQKNLMKIEVLERIDKSLIFLYYKKISILRASKNMFFIKSFSRSFEEVFLRFPLLDTNRNNGDLQKLS